MIRTVFCKRNAFINSHYCATNALTGNDKIRDGSVGVDTESCHRLIYALRSLPSWKDEYGKRADDILERLVSLWLILPIQLLQSSEQRSKPS